MRILGTIAFYAICLYAFAQAAPSLSQQLINGLIAVLVMIGA